MPEQKLQTVLQAEVNSPSFTSDLCGAIGSKKTKTKTKTFLKSGFFMSVYIFSRRAFWAHPCYSHVQCVFSTKDSSHLNSVLCVSGCDPLPSPNYLSWTLIENIKNQVKSLEKTTVVLQGSGQSFHWTKCSLMQIICTI